MYITLDIYTKDFAPNRWLRVVLLLSESALCLYMMSSAARNIGTRKLVSFDAGCSCDHEYMLCVSLDSLVVEI